jgi:hypothetical protein
VAMEPLQNRCQSFKVSRQVGVLPDHWVMLSIYRYHRDQQRVCTRLTFCTKPSRWAKVMGKANPRVVLILLKFKATPNNFRVPTLLHPALDSFRLVNVAGSSLSRRLGVFARPLGGVFYIMVSR